MTNNEKERMNDAMNSVKHLAEDMRRLAIKEALDVVIKEYEKIANFSFDRQYANEIRWQMTGERFMRYEETRWRLKAKQDIAVRIINKLYELSKEK